MKDQSQTQPRAVALLKQILEYHELEMDCETCGEKLNCLADLVEAGNDPDKVLPAVQRHLECCGECKEVFEAMLAIVRAEKSGKC